MSLLAGLAIGAGSKILGGIFGSRDEGLPPDIIDLIRQFATNPDTSGFLPDKSAYEADFNAKMKNILAGLPVGIENFNTDLASRGIFRSGEAPKNLYSQVFAPVAGQLASGAAASNLGYAQAYQQGRMGQEQLRANALQMLMQAVMNRRPSIGGVIGEGLAGAGGDASQYLLLKSLLKPAGGPK